MNNTDVERWFEGLPLSAAEFFRICDKCKCAIRINGGRHEYHYLGKCKPEAAEPPSLSLLVCDFGDWRVLYHEHGDAWTLAVNEWEFRFDDDRDAHLTRLPFADIKAAIDAQLEDVPPVRIELGEDGDYHLYGNGITGFRLIPEEYYLLCELAGQVGATQNLPIYEPKRGTWTEIGHIDDEVYRNSEIRVWRFTR